MVKEFFIHARPSNKKASTVVRGAIISAALCLIACFFINRYQGVVSTAAVIFAAVAILFYTKYVTAEYIYELVNDSEGVALFVVRTRTGRRETTMLRLPLYAIASIERVSGEEMQKTRTDPSYPRHNYCPTFRPESAVLLRFRSRFDSADVYIEVSDELVSHLLSLAESEREQVAPDEE